MAGGVVYFLMLVLITLANVDAFGVRPTVSSSKVRSISSPAASSLSMVFGPNIAAEMEKKKNPKKYESTIQNLMKQNKLTRQQAEKRYGEFLADPDGFALRAAAQERKEKGYKDWKEQAIAKSDDPEATRKRIEEFQKKSTLKATAMITIFGSAAMYYSSINQFVPPTH
mmetsp:Transcript_27619/g.41795  ORF Transcript_27619/g.41795 Transcript_27619/m.41795 type:complete len:169 (-) Transcript_27619:1634-2140(-)|eukprot:CAMPEP_0178923706 /NCGR_PEP_ID=MMETSP0786-20121207/16898_1 /TAXON_ID=186022 /ORGANISM="Thalassionema frauenfeldii, Strain CCMP 1798" /LENGTH=168 /DNA_ID=CAMNT_0020598291 /DNA_START=123 /DNA_END=629 /DNA_ORIENTATION=-